MRTYEQEPTNQRTNEQDDQIEMILIAHPRDGVYSNYNHTPLR